jgi:hypothetical protein
MKCDQSISINKLFSNNHSVCNLFKNSKSRVAVRVVKSWPVVSLSQVVLRTISHKQIVVHALLIILLLINKLIFQHRISSLFQNPPPQVIDPVSIEQFIFNLSQFMNGH